LPQPVLAPSPLLALGKAIFASEAEIAANPRARSAVLRIAEKRNGEDGA
jgi:16S rRNA (cytosine1402-N4)-methyltransferase